MPVQFARCVSIFSMIMMLGATAVADQPKAMHHYAREHGAGMNMDVPTRPLQRNDVERWAKLLNASEAQLQFMVAEYARFVDRYNAFMDEAAPRYLELGRELTELYREEGISSPAYAQLGRDVDQASIRLRDQLISLENSYIDRFEPILTPQQAQHVPLLRHDARRRNCRTFRSFMRWIDVELRDIWIATAAESASPEQTRRVRMILADYEPRLTELICRRADLHFELRARLRANRIARNEGAVSLVEARSRYKRIMRRRLEADRAVQLLNQATVERITSLLPDGLRAAFVAGGKEAAFPELYPDETRLHQFMEQLAEDFAENDELDEDLRATVSRLIAAYRVEYTRLCDELETKCIEWGNRNSEGISGYQIQFLRDALKPLLKERTEHSRRYLMKLREHLGPEVLERHAALIPQALRQREDETATP